MTNIKLSEMLKHLIINEENKMYRTIEVTESEEVLIKLPKEYVNKLLEIYVLPVDDNKVESAGRERDFIDEYYG